jgi:hypothetical protein
LRFRNELPKTVNCNLLPAKHLEPPELSFQRLFLVVIGVEAKLIFQRATVQLLAAAHTGFLRYLLFGNLFGGRFLSNLLGYLLHGFLRCFFLGHNRSPLRVSDGFVRRRFKQLKNWLNRPNKNTTYFRPPSPTSIHLPPLGEACFLLDVQQVVFSFTPSKKYFKALSIESDCFFEKKNSPSAAVRKRLQDGETFISQIAEEDGNVYFVRFQQRGCRNQDGRENRKNERLDLTLLRIKIEQDFPGDSPAVEWKDRQEIHKAPKSANIKNIVDEFGTHGKWR